MTVAVVTDSASDIPAGLASQHAISIVPLTIRFGDKTYRSGVDLGAAEFWRELRTSPDSPTTAAPSAGDFQEVFETLVRSGATSIISVHLSSKLSATYQSAVLAARESSVPVAVVDSLSVSAGLGLLVLQAAEMASEGRSAPDIARAIEALRGRVHLIGTIDTLEYLRRGGRIGRAQALLGSMLKFKPIIGVVEGEVDALGRVRTRPKAIEHVVDLVRPYAGRIERLVVVSGDAPDTDEFVRAISGVVPVDSSDVWDFGPVVGTHAGPGVVGVAFIASA